MQSAIKIRHPEINKQWKNSMTSSSSGRNNLLQTFSNNLADLTEESGRSVVTVNARRRISSSGVYWRSGIVVTVEHAIKREEEITVTDANGRTLAASLIGRDPGTDLALLKIEEIDLPTATIGDLETLKVGHMVLAIARNNESGLSASFGVMSSLGGAWRSWYGEKIDRFLSPSLMLYPGFSGGALVDMEGQVLGINTRGPRHMTLTIPNSTVNRVVEQIMQGGRIKRGYLGLGMQSVSLPDTLKKALNLSNSGGVIIVSLSPGEAADRAGITIGDILISLDGTAINDISNVYSMLDPERVGQPLTAGIIRGGNLLEVTIIVGEKPIEEDCNFDRRRGGYGRRERQGR
ncbi:MAG: S1C family serine protease [Xenococcaceae cyanobacterium]